MSKKVYSTTYDRACHILIYMVDKYLASAELTKCEDYVRCSELSDVLNVSKPPVYDALNLLIKWRHISKVMNGRKAFYKLTDNGLAWIEKHEGYVVQRAEINKATIHANK